MNFSTLPFSQKIEKPWGYEIIYTNPDLPFTGKLLFVKAGKRLSFQYHDQKEECLCLLEGEAILWLENDKQEIEKIQMEQKKGYYIQPLQKHRLCAVSDCLVTEASTPEKGETIRLEDDYQRTTETEETRKQPSRGWKHA